MKKIKTNAMRKLDKEKIPYIFHSYIIRPKITLQELSSDIGKDPHLIFKTLVTVSPDQSYYVFCLPLEDELDLKKAAKVANVKSLSMIDQNNLLTLTGYERGGVSPLGMKKSFPTYIDRKALDLKTIIVSAGKKGFQLELAILDIQKMTKANFVDLLMETKSIF